jgi:hypothetical protein
MFWPSPQPLGTLHARKRGSTTAPKDFVARKEKKRTHMRLIIGEMGDARVDSRKLACFICNCGG